MVTGEVPPDETGLSSTRRNEPPLRIRSTEIWLLPASATRRKRPSLDAWSAPCEPMPAPVPAPPAANGEPAIGESEPSACRSNPATVFMLAVLSFT